MLTTVELPQETGWELLAEIPNNILYQWLKKHNPQVQAIIIHKLPKDKAKELMVIYSPKDIVDILTRLANIKPINQDAYDILEKYIMDNYQNLLPNKGIHRFDLIEGLEKGKSLEVASILNQGNQNVP